jgi:hypothetical protein
VFNGGGLDTVAGGCFRFRSGYLKLTDNFYVNSLRQYCISTEGNIRDLYYVGVLAFQKAAEDVGK